MKKEELYKKFSKVVVNSGIGRLSSMANFGDKVLPEIEKEFGMIVGQKLAQRAARISIAGFKMRAGTVVGLMATLRGRRVQQFLEKVINVVLPRVRDFRGLDAKSVDGSGNLTFGFREHIVFPEINPEKSNVNFGIQMTVVPKNVKSREEALELYKKIGVPFKREK